MQQVYLLKTELRGPAGQRVIATLPCPESELTQWLAASQRQVANEELGKLVRANPTLLLIAASRAVACTGAPIQSMIQLQSRLDHCFSESTPIDTAIGHVLEVESNSSQSFDWALDAAAVVARFHKARKRKQLVKSLVNFIRLMNKQSLPKKQRPSKTIISKFIDSLFVDAFQVRRCKPTNWPVETNAKSTDGSNSALLGLLKDRQATKNDWDQRLRDSKLVAMKQLAYGASHEINNPLANVATRAHTMLAGETDPDRRFQLAVIHEQAMRAHDMISDMMLFAHPPALRKESVDVRLMLCALIRESESNMLPLIRSGASVTATVAKGVERATFDKTHLKVALASLIQNAAEAIRHDDGEIEIRVSSEEDQLCFAVADNGIGINETVQQHLFDPFYSGREAGRGLGFGLSKSWRIAMLHGGSLTHRVDAEELTTVFELRLPVRVDD